MGCRPAGRAQSHGATRPRGHLGGRPRPGPKPRCETAARALGRPAGRPGAKPRSETAAQAVRRPAGGPSGRAWGKRGAKRPRFAGRPAGAWAATAGRNEMAARPRDASAKGSRASKAGWTFSFSLCGHKVSGPPSLQILTTSFHIQAQTSMFKGAPPGGAFWGKRKTPTSAGSKNTRFLRFAGAGGWEG